MTPRPIDDTLLHAFVDGDLDDVTRGEVQQWLDSHPEDLARVRAFVEQRALLHATFDKVLEEPIPTRLLQAARGQPRRSPWWQLAAAVALLAIGAGGGWMARDRLVPTPLAAAAPGFAERAIDAFVIYTAEVRHPVEVPASEEEHLVRWLSRKLGKPINLPDLSSVGFHLVGGRLLPDDGKPAAQFMYEDASKRRVTLYMRVVPEAKDTGFSVTQDRDVTAFHWIDGPFGYCLTATLPREQVLQLAQMVYESGPK